MPQRRRRDTSTAIAVANEHWSAAPPPHMVWDEHVALANLEDQTSEAVIHGQSVEDRIATLRHAMAHRAMMILTEKELGVVRRHYGFHTGEPMTFHDVAEDLNTTYNSVQKTNARALKRMRRVLGVKRKRLKV